MLALIMAGGVGERFWPLSRRRRPKQILDLTGRGSMIRLTLDRISGLCDPKGTLVVTNAEQRDAVVEALDGCDLPADNVIGEPVGRNTAACIGLAARVFHSRGNDEPMLVLPADHLVEPVDAFQRSVRSAAAYIERHGGLLTFGIVPTRPETGYGYIQAADAVETFGESRIRRVEAFLEKPDEAHARTFVEAGRHFWNSGMFVWTPHAILGEMSAHMPALSAPLSELDEEVGTPRFGRVLESVYNRIPSISIDYGVMEKSTSVVVMEAAFGWNDVGSWGFIRDVADADADGNVMIGDHVAVDSTGNTIVSKDRLVALLGVDDLVVVDGGDTILVCDRRRVQEVKRIVGILKDRNKTELL